jgi:tetratricopeptide (TPR) repeat protein
MGYSILQFGRSRGRQVPREVEIQSMVHTVNHRRLRVALGFAVATAAGLATALPAQAQERHRVLVPNFEARAEVRGNFGRDIAQQIQRGLQTMPRHQNVDARHLRDQLRNLNVREQDLNCITGMQLSVRTGYELVLCGDFEPAPQGGMMVKARVVVPETQDAFEIEQFHAADPRAGAAHILQAFQEYTQMLTVAVTCQEYLESQQWETAVATCDRALAIAPRAQTPLYGRAFALMQLERNEESLAAFERLLEVAPGNMDATLAAGLVATKLDQGAKAMEYFRTYLEMNPGEISVRMAVANDIFRAGDPQAALRIVEEGMTGEAANNIDMIQYAGHLAVASAQQLQQGSAANGSDPQVRQMYEKGLAYFDRVYADRAGETEVSTLQQMMAAYVALGQNDRAIAFGQRATQTHDDAQLWLNLARALHTAGRVPDAVAALERVERIDANTRGIAGLRAQWMLSQGNLAGARTAFRQAVERGEIPSDQAAAMIAGHGWNQFGRVDRHQQGIEYYTVAREFAQSAEARAQANFFEGYAILKIGEAKSQPNTFASANASIGDFRRALELLRGAEAYSSQAATRRTLMEAAQQFIDTQEALIRRGNR